MLNLERIFKQDRLIRAMTGLNSKAFKALLPSFTEAYEKSAIAAFVDTVLSVKGKQAKNQFPPLKQR